MKLENACFGIDWWWPDHKKPAPVRQKVKSGRTDCLRTLSESAFSAAQYSTLCQQAKPASGASSPTTRYPVILPLRAFIGSPMFLWSSMLARAVLFPEGSDMVDFNQLIIVVFVPQ